MISNRVLWIGLIVLVLVIVVAPMLVGAMVGPGVAPGPGMMWGRSPQGVPQMMTGWGWGVGLAVGRLAMLAFWGALITGVILLVRGLRREGTESRTRDPGEALAILRRRYAAGEIKREEFEQMRKDLAV